MSEYYLMHSAKGTSWFKKEHKYIKKIDGKYYYLTKKEISDVERAQEILDNTAVNQNEARELQKQYEQNSRDKRAEATNLSASSQNRINKIGSDYGSIYSAVQSNKAAKEAKRSTEALKESYSSAANARAQSTRFQSNAKANIQAQQLKNSTIANKGIKWLNKLLGKE